MGGDRKRPKAFYPSLGSCRECGDLPDQNEQRGDEVQRAARYRQKDICGLPNQAVVVELRRSLLAAIYFVGVGGLFISERRPSLRLSHLSGGEKNKTWSTP